MSDARASSLTTRAQLVDALAVACELEHGLSLQYLFAAFSLRKDPNEGLGDGQLLTACRRWAASIFFVAAQEMLHLAQASNLLLAIGGAPHLARPNFPQPAGAYPPDLGWELTAFSKPTLDRFIAYESPDTPPKADDPSGPSDPIVRTRLTHTTIGEMYAAIERAFATLELPTGELFIGDPRHQIPGSLVNFPQLIEVTDRVSAARACALIIEQGEGTRADHVDSHFGVFSGIRAELIALQRSNPSFSPARPVADNPLGRLHTDVGASGSGDNVNIISDPTTRAVLDVFTSSYDVLLLALFRFFAGGRNDPWAPAVKQVSFELMMTVIRPLGDLLTRLPMGPGFVGLTAGPSFETYPGIELLPHPEAARVLMAERLAATAHVANELVGNDQLDRRAAAVVDAVSASLAEMAATLTGDPTISN